MSYQVDSYGNAYFPAGVSVASIPATTGTQAKVLVPGVNGRISSATVAQLITQSGGNLVSSIFGRTGVITAQQGDYNTDQVTEGQAQYFSTSRARKSIFLTTFNTSGPATYDSSTGILNIPQYISSSGIGTGGSYVPLTRTITINGQTADLSIDRIFSVQEMVYPSIGIPLSNGTSWATSITDNSANWNTAYGWGNHASGGYVTLAGAQTISGDKTFTSDLKSAMVSIANSNSLYTRTGYTTLSASNVGTASWIAYVWGNVGGGAAVLAFNNAAQYTYTFPSLSGTIALTSDLSAYVPYTGATADINTGNFSIYSNYLNLKNALYLNGDTYNGAIVMTSNKGGQIYATTNSINITPAGIYLLDFTFGGAAGGAANLKNFRLDVTSLNVNQLRTYIMPNASGTLALTSDIVTYTLPTASTSVLGGVKVDGTTITADVNGVISGANTYSLPTATSTILGGVKIGAGVTITSGVISVSTNYEAPITAGTTSEYWRGDKSWQTLPVYTLSGLGGLPLAGGIMTGAITLKEGLGNGLKFPNDIFGGSGDTAGMRLITRAGESMSLEMYLTNDADDWFNIVVPSDNGAKVNGNTIWHAANLTNLNQLSNGPGYITGYTETDTLSSVTARGASTSTAVVVNNTLTVNNSSHYDSAQFSLDVNGGLLVKNVGKTALFLLINSNPATGGNNAFVQHTVGGTLSSSYATIQGYYGASVTGSTVLKLNPLGGDVLIGTLIGTGTRMVVADANGVVSTQAIPSVSSVAWTSVTSRPTALSQFTNDLGNYGGWITSYNETDTLGSVTARGATTSTALTLSSQANNFGGHHYFIAYDAAGNHYPHYQNGSSNVGAIVNTRVYTGSGASWRLFVLNGQTAGISWDGNVIYHAGNIPTWNQNTTGTAANITATTNSTLTTLSSLSLPYSQLSGTVPTWNQSTTGNAATVTNATFYRQFTVRDDRSDGSDYSLAARATGLYAINSTGTNGPGYGYLSLIHVANGGDVAFQIAGGYNSDAMYFRGTTALQNGTGYSTWRTVIHSGNIASQTVTYATGETLATVTGRGATTSTAVIINNNLAVNTASPYATSVYSLDINGGLLVKNTGRASNITLINSDPAGGGNHAFVIHTVSGTLGSSLVDIQGYYGANVVGSTTIRLNPLGGNVTINGYTVYHAGNIPTLNQSTTGNAATSSTFSTGRTNYKGVTDNAVAGQLMWKNYANNHTIFDASASTSPDGTAVNNTNSGTAWAATYPTLMGWNGSSTYGVRVDSARLADSASSVAWGNVTGRPTALSSFTNDLGNYGGWITSSGSISGTASNITAYTINQSVGSGNSPTFAGLTVSGPVYQGAANQGVISLLSDVIVGQTNNYFRLYLPQGYYDNRNGGTATIKIVWGMLHAGVTYSQEYKLTFGTNHGAGGNYLHSSQVTKTYSDQNPESYGGYLMDQTPSVDFYHDMSGGYINFNVKGVHSYNTHRVVAVDIVGGGVGTPTLTYYGTSSPGGSALTVKDIPYATSAGSANLASQVTINYSNDSNSTYQLLWGSGNSVYGTGDVYVNPYTDVINARGGFISTSNPWGTSDSAYFPNGITTANATNWIYGFTYIGNAPSNGSGVEVRANGSSYFRSSGTSGTHGYAGQFVDRSSAANNYIPWSFENEYGNHSWGIVARYHVQGSASDRPSIQFSSGFANNRWSIGYCLYDDNFRITQNQGYRTDGSGISDGWGTERFRINTDGNTYCFASFTASGDVTAYSDIRVKTNIETVTNAIEKIKSIRGVTFTRTDTDDKERKHLGVVAQEVLDILPEVISETDKGLYTVAYGNMAGLFIEAIKEQQAQIEEMKKEIKELKNK